MSGYKSRRSESKFTDIFSGVLIILFVLAPVYFALSYEKKPGKVVIFVVDSLENSIPEVRKQLIEFKGYGHGEIVSRIVNKHTKPDDLCFRNVDSYIGGKIDNEKFKSVLLEIAIFAYDHNDCRIVVNISLGKALPEKLETTLIKLMGRKNVVMIAAAGNDHANRVDYPGGFDEVIAVGAYERGQLASYSNYGEQIDVFAKGVCRYKQKYIDSIRGVTYTRDISVRGTSFASPHVAGVIAEMLKYKPDLTTDAIRTILKETSKSIKGHKSGSLRRLKALSMVSKKYKFKYLIWTIVVLLCFIVVAVVPVVIAFFLLKCIGDLLFRTFLPSRWMSWKIKKIAKIVAKQRQEQKDVDFIIRCLYPGYEPLMDTAHCALMQIGMAALPRLNYWYKSVDKDKAVDFKTPIDRIIKEITERKNLRRQDG